MSRAATWRVLLNEVSASSIALVTFACTFGLAVGAAYLRELLPAPHLAKESQDVVRLGMGLVATMTALLLGLVTASAKSTFDESNATVRTAGVNFLSLDRDLARYGPETRPTRDLLKRLLAFRVDSTWPADGQAASVTAPLPTTQVEEIGNQILFLAPRDDAQRWLKNESLRLSEDVLKARWRVLEAGGNIPRSFLIAVIFWLTATFGSFGLYAPRNATVITVLCIASLSVAAAVFLIVELDGPFDGWIKVSGEPLRFALGNMGQ
jgi:hypothetical protein